MRVVAVLTVMLILPGCRTTAFIHKKDGTVLEGKIRRSDATTVFIVPAEPSEDNVVHPSDIPERVNATLVQEILDECIAERTVKCRKRCKESYPSTHTKADAMRCMSACLDQDTARSLCEVISVEIPIARADIDDVDHPGSSHACIGLSLTGAGAIAFGAALILSRSTGEEGLSDDEVAWCSAGLLVALAGIISVPVWIWGSVVWLDSSSSYAPPVKRKKPKLKPLALSDGERTYWGMGLSWSW